MPVVDFESFASERVVLHALVVPRANCVQIGTLLQLFELLGSLVHREDLLDTVIMIAYIVAVFVNA